MIESAAAKMIFFGAAAWAVGGSLLLAWKIYQHHCCQPEFGHDVFVCSHGKVWVPCAPVYLDAAGVRLVVSPGWIRIPHFLATQVLATDLDAELVQLTEVFEEE